MTQPPECIDLTTIYVEFRQIPRCLCIVFACRILIIGLLLASSCDATLFSERFFETGGLVEFNDVEQLDVQYFTNLTLPGFMGVPK